MLLADSRGKVPTLDVVWSGGSTMGKHVAPAPAPAGAGSRQQTETPVFVMRNKLSVSRFEYFDEGPGSKRGEPWKRV